MVPEHLVRTFPPVPAVRARLDTRREIWNVRNLDTVTSPFSVHFLPNTGDYDITMNVMS